MGGGVCELWVRGVVVVCNCFADRDGGGGLQAAVFMRAV